LVVKSIKNDEPSAVEQLMARPGPWERRGTQAKNIEKNTKKQKQLQEQQSKEQETFYFNWT
jgi:hypothetical protein